MLVVLNGKKTDLPAGTTVAGLIEKKNLNPDTVIVEYNGDLLKRESWPGTVLNENDCLELLRFVGGG